MSGLVRHHRTMGWNSELRSKATKGNPPVDPGGGISPRALLESSQLASVEFHLILGMRFRRSKCVQLSLVAGLTRKAPVEIHRRHGMYV